jgi:hypothetical protein
MRVQGMTMHLSSLTPALSQCERGRRTAPGTTAQISHVHPTSDGGVILRQWQDHS